MISSQLFAKQSGRRRSPEPGSLAVSLNAGVCVREGGAGSGVREIPGLLRQSQAQSSALHISSCMQLRERERGERVLPSRSRQCQHLEPPRTCFSHLQTPSLLPRHSLPEKERREGLEMELTISCSYGRKPPLRSRQCGVWRPSRWATTGVGRAVCSHGSSAPLRT